MGQVGEREGRGSDEGAGDDDGPGRDCFRAPGRPRAPCGGVRVTPYRPPARFLV